MLSRRSFVGKLAGGAAAACAVGTAQAKSRETIPQIADGSSASTADAASPPEGAAAPWQLLRPLAIGAAVAGAWRLVGMTGAEHGSCVLTLENARGRTHRVHLCRNDGRPQGLVFTDRFDLVVMNGGQGDLPTEEGLARAVAEIAHVLAGNEGTLRYDPTVTALLSHAERVKRFADAARLR